MNPRTDIPSPAVTARDRCTSRREQKNEMEETLNPTHTRKAQQLDSPLLQLPVEIILLISKALSPASRAIISQTCWSLRIIVGSNPARTLRDYERAEYLTSMARSMPEQWVCEACLALHPVHGHDIPGTLHAWTCPRRYYRGDVYDVPFVDISFRHVQLALKYVRLGNQSRRSYLHKLVAPYDHDFNAIRYRGIAAMDPLTDEFTVNYSVYPKVVMGADGDLRYLTLSVWVYEKGCLPVSLYTTRGHLSLSTMGRQLYICKHQAFGYVDPLPEAIDSAFESNAEQRRSCLGCRTDYSVEASPDRLELRVWRDLDDGSPIDSRRTRLVVWRDNIRSGHPHNSALLENVSHKPGSIRDLYNSGECEAQKLLCSPYSPSPTDA
jgi:hypothetical protein